jgi:hypothetical protein
MNSNTPLPPHLEQFVREQIAAGRFHSEGDVLRAALQLLEESSHADKPSGFRPYERVEGFSRQSLPLVAPERWEVLHGSRADTAVTDQPPSPAKRSPRGLLADLRSSLSPDEIADARHEMWAGFLHGEAG